MLKFLLVQIFCPLDFPPLRNLGIPSSLSLMGMCWVMWFCLGGRNLGLAHSLGQLFCPLVCPLFRNLGITSALSLWGRCWVMWFFLGEEKFEHGSSLGSAILSSGLSFTYKFGHSFSPESVGEVLGSVVLY